MEKIRETLNWSLICLISGSIAWFSSAFAIFGMVAIIGLLSLIGLVISILHYIYNWFNNLKGFHANSTRRN